MLTNIINLVDLLETEQKSIQVSEVWQCVCLFTVVGEMAVLCACLLLWEVWQCCVLVYCCGRYGSAVCLFTVVGGMAVLCACLLLWEVWQCCVLVYCCGRYGSAVCLFTVVGGMAVLCACLLFPGENFLLKECTSIFCYGCVCEFYSKWQDE